MFMHVFVTCGSAICVEIRIIMCSFCSRLTWLFQLSYTNIRVFFSVSATKVFSIVDENFIASMDISFMNMTVDGVTLATCQCLDNPLSMSVRTLEFGSDVRGPTLKADSTTSSFTDTRSVNWASVHTALFLAGHTP